MSPARLASTAALSSGSRWRTISSMTAVFMPARCSCANGLPASTASSCFSSPTSTTRGMRSASAIRRRSRAWTVEANEPSSTTSTVFRYARPHLLSALSGHASFGDAAVPGQEELKGLARQAGLGCEGAGGGRRRRKAPDLVALLLEKGAGAVQHGGLAGAGIALHAHHPVTGREDQVHGVLLALRQGGRSGAPCRPRGFAWGRRRVRGRPPRARWPRAHGPRPGRW